MPVGRLIVSVRGVVLVVRPLGEILTPVGSCPRRVYRLARGVTGRAASYRADCAANDSANRPSDNRADRCSGKCPSGGTGPSANGMRARLARERIPVRQIVVDLLFKCIHLEYLH